MRLFCLLSASRVVLVKQRKYLCVGFERFFYNDYVRARKVLLRLIYAAMPFVFLKLA